MPVPPYGDVGIVSNPDARPASDPATTWTIPSNANDPQARDVTYLDGGRKTRIAVRNADAFKSSGNN